MVLNVYLFYIVTMFQIYQKYNTTDEMIEMSLSVTYYFM